ncbi:MAG: dTDP-4-dehydrorhamnose 3,5-epimerase [Bacteroidota bacterium]|nr:dTDP-4-dehydrorhamnose 3,5-epimerase [Bacteroidota bacterium]
MYSDPDLNIDWKMLPDEILVSVKDTQNATFKEFKKTTIG